MTTGKCGRFTSREALAKAVTALGGDLDVAKRTYSVVQMPDTAMALAWGRMQRARAPKSRVSTNRTVHNMLAPYWHPSPAAETPDEEGRTS